MNFYRFRIQKQYFRPYTQGNVYKDFNTNWDEKVTRDTKIHIPKLYGKKDIFDTKFLWNIVTRGKAAIGVCLQDITQPGLHLKWGHFSQAFTVHW